MDFDVNRYLNTHKDYFAFKHLRQHIHKQFTTDINPLPIYKIKDGFITWENASSNYKLMVTDIHGNSNKIRFELNKSKSAIAKVNPLINNEYYYPNEINSISLAGFETIIEPSQFYEPIEQKVSIEKSENGAFLSDLYRLFEYVIPVQSGINIRIEIPEVHKNLPVNKLGIAVLDDKNRIYFQGGYHEQGWITHKIRHFGKFTLMIDTIPPVIEPLDYKNNQNISKYSTLEFKISDNLSGLASYKAYINGEWVLTLYNRSKKRYIIPLDKRSKKHLVSGDNVLLIRTIDKVKNVTEVSINLIYQQ